MDKDFNLALFGAFRYAIGRKTYFVETIVDLILRRWSEIENGFKLLMVDEIKHAIKNNKAGMDMDVEQWKKILEKEENDSIK